MANFLKEHVCPGCGKTMGAFELDRHAAGCKRDHVRPGMVFRINAPTTIGGAGGQVVRRPIEVEILSRSGDGWLVKSKVSGRTLFIKSFRRFIDWKEFTPGLEHNRGHKRKNG